MKNCLNIFQGCTRHTGLAQIGADEFHLTGCEDVLNVFEAPAGEIINNANAGALLQKFVDHIRSDKRGTARYKYQAARPPRIRSHSRLASSTDLTNVLSCSTLS